MPTCACTAGLTPVTKLNTPAYIFTVENVQAASNPATLNDCCGFVQTPGVQGPPEA